jgi:hypothetical protein
LNGRLICPHQSGPYYESPFTDKNPMGVNGVFGLSDAKAVVAVIEAVRRFAAA